MTRLLSSIIRAASNLRQSWVISTITTAIISICLLLVGGYLLVTLNLGTALENLRTQVSVTIYLRGGFPPEATDELQDRLSSFPEVESVTYTSRQQALDEFREMLGREDDLLDGLNDFPLPASLRLTPAPAHRTVEGIHSILALIGDEPLIDDIRYGQEWLTRLEKITEVLYAGTFVFGGLLSLAAIFIISNTIKITVLARREELEIMRLVGATESFIRMPFFIEGMIQGLTGALVSLGLLALLHRFIATRLDSSILMIFNIRTLHFLPMWTILAILTGGMVLGGLGSLSSVGRFSRK